jgi:hypothetical protein
MTLAFIGKLFFLSFIYIQLKPSYRRASFSLRTLNHIHCVDENSEEVAKRKVHSMDDEEIKFSFFPMP